MSVVPPSVARRRTWWTIGGLVLVWLVGISVVGLCFHGRSVMLLGMPIGQLTSGLVGRVWLGFSRSAAVTEAGGRTYVSARTLIGTRTVDLDDLVRVRYAGPVGKDETPKNRPGWWIRDGQGMRLAFRPSLERGPVLEDALRQAVRRADGRPIDMNLATSDRLTSRRLTAGYQASGPDFVFVMIAGMSFSPLCASLIAGLFH